MKRQCHQTKSGDKNVLISRLHLLLFCPQTLINVSSWEALLDPSIDLICKEERLSCSSSDSWDLGAQKVVQLFYVSQSLMGRMILPFPFALCCLFSLWPRGPPGQGGQVVVPLSHSMGVLSKWVQLSRVTCGSAWEGSETSGGIQRGVGFGRLNYHPSIHQSVWASVSQGGQDHGVRWERHKGLGVRCTRSG